jgi:hypothetical protein
MRVWQILNAFSRLVEKKLDRKKPVMGKNQAQDPIWSFGRLVVFSLLRHGDEPSLDSLLTVRIWAIFNFPHPH